MSTSTSIEWTDAKWNPIVGCSKVSPGCANCYAERMAGRLAAMGQRPYQDVVAATDTHYGPLVMHLLAERTGIDIQRSRWNGKTTLVESALHTPLGWRKPKRVFVCSMSDLFHEANPDEWIRLVHAQMSIAGQHTFQLLTKRPERAAAWYANPANSLSACQAEWVTRFPSPNLTPTGRDRVRNTRAINGTHRGLGDGNYWPLPNVWLGTSCEDQQRAAERIPHLLRCPSAVRFLSLEPLLGPVQLVEDGPGGIPSNYDGHNRPLLRLDALRGGHRIGGGNYRDTPRINWVIVGGESGPNARPCNVEWIRSIVRQCRVAGVPCFVEQLGARSHCGTYSERCDSKRSDPAEWPADLRVRQWPQSVHTEANR